MEAYGVFIRFGRGRQGLVHISNICHRRIAHPAEILKVGDSVEAKVLDRTMADNGVATYRVYTFANMVPMVSEPLAATSVGSAGGPPAPTELM